MRYEFYVPVPEKGIADDAETDPHAFDTLPQAIADYVAMRPAFTAEQLQAYLAERYDISLDPVEFAGDLPQLMAAVAVWHARGGTPMEYIILEPSEAAETPAPEEPQEDLAPTDPEPTLAAVPVAQRPPIVPAQTQRPLQNVPETDFIAEVEHALSPVEIEVTKIAIARLSWHTARGGVLASELVAWMAIPGFSKQAAAQLVERLYYRRLIITIGGDAANPLLTLADGVNLSGLPVLLQDKEDTNR